MIGELSRQIEQRWEALGLPGPVVPSEQRWLVINGGIGARSKLVCLLWTDRGEEPAYVVKFARRPEYNGTVEAEYRALKAIQSIVSRRLSVVGRRSSVVGRPSSPGGLAPTPLTAFCLNGLLVSVETALPGHLLRHYLREHPRRHLRTLRGLESLMRRLISLHALSARPATPEDMRAFVFEPLESALEEFGDFSAQETRSIEQLHTLAQEMAARQPLRIVFSHSDLTATNIMVDHEGALTGVIDWEFAGPGLPLLDLFYFLSAYGHETREQAGGQPLRGFRELFFLPPSTHAGSLPLSLSERWTRAYCRRLGIDPRWLPLLFGFTWLLHARNERQRELSGRWSQTMDDGLSTMHGERRNALAPSPQPPAPGQAHFRSRLRYFLENRDASLVERMAGGARP